MRAVIQRVNSASVTVDQKEVARIERGLVIFLGVVKGDASGEVEYLARKIQEMRIFNDQKRKMNLCAKEVNAEVLVVSQFTLCADTSKGNRPSFIKAAKPELAQRLYKKFVEELREKGLIVKTGEFGAMMNISLINDGPVTIILDTKPKLTKTS